jgi:hypothetical protein
VAATWRHSDNAAARHGVVMPPQTAVERHQDLDAVADDALHLLLVPVTRAPARRPRHPRPRQVMPLAARGANALLATREFAGGAYEQLSVTIKPTLLGPQVMERVAVPPRPSFTVSVTVPGARATSVTGCPYRS